MKSELPIPLKMQLATRRQNRELDRQTIENFGISGFTLMEIAGLEAAKFISKVQKNLNKGLFLCGKGNNAGDALVAARHLSDYYEHEVSLFFIDGTEDLSPDTQKNLELLRKLKNGKIHFLSSLDGKEFSNYDYIVDGLLGTGLKDKLRENYSSVADLANQQNVPVYSLDIPTGLDCDTGKILGTAIKADFTLTFGSNKIGFYLNNGPEFTGQIEVFPLSFPSQFREYDAALIDEHFTNVIGPIVRDADHKYQKGTVHIIAGSEGLTGAAIMAAKSAWKSGAGAVFLYAPQKLLTIYESTLPEIIKIPVGSDSDAHYTKKHSEIISSKIKEKPGVLVVGPGIGNKPETSEFVVQLLTDCNLPAVIDADALIVWKQLRNLNIEKKKKWLFTPHPGELSKYFNISENDDFNRMNKVKEISVKEGVSILSKGNPVIYSDFQDQQFITGYDTLMFSRAGFGDVLAGTIAANIAITNEITLSVIHALVSGYQKYQSLQDKADFKPSNLL